MRSVIFRTLVTTIIFTFFTLPVTADWHWGDPYVMHQPQTPSLAGWAVYSSPDVMPADNWYSPGTGHISEFHFWGSWKNGIEGELIAFRLYVYDDDPAYPSQIPYGRPADLLWEREIPIDMVLIRPMSSPLDMGWYRADIGEVITDDHRDYFQYNVFLPEEMYFPTLEGHEYWLAIEAVVADPQTTSWGWNTSWDNWVHDAVYLDVGSGEWNVIPGSIVDPPNLAFVVNGTPPCDCIPGDANGDMQVNVGDAVYIISHVFKGGPLPYPYASCSGDANGDCVCDVGDAVYIINSIWCMYYPCPRPPNCVEWIEICDWPLR